MHSIIRIIIPAASLLLASCHTQDALFSLEVSNAINEDRCNEMAELPATALPATKGLAFRLVDAGGAEVPYQFTSDGKFIFPVSVAAGGSVRIKAIAGSPAPVDTLVGGRLYAERDDDFAWENDRMAYRAYGPALQRRGERGFGYDIFTKSVEYPVLERFYAGECNEAVWKEINALRRQGLKEKGDSLERTISYHVDHGEGMDVFSVGPTLGGGTAALLDATGDIVFPWCYATCEVTDRGPLRFGFRLKFHPMQVDTDKEVTETRTIALDRGSFLNRTTLRYDGLTSPHRLAAGIALRKQHPDGYVTDTANGFVAYADSTDNAHVGNGVIFVGALSDAFNATEVRPYTPAEQSEHGGALGHVLAIGSYAPQSELTYWWGSGWSKGFMPDMETWATYLRHARRCIGSPLRVTVRK